MVSCFNEDAVWCSSSANQSCISERENVAAPSIQNAVICHYKITLSNQKQLLVILTWSRCRNHMGGQGQGQGQGLNIGFADDPSAATSKFRKKKGSKYFEYDDSKIQVLWDLSAATYESGPEPIDRFYLLLMVGSELGLMLGDMAQEMATKKTRTGTQMAKFCLVSRREHYSLAGNGNGNGNALYSTKAQFCDTGIAHEILIHCVAAAVAVAGTGNKGGLKQQQQQPVLSVSIDKRTVTQVKRLDWNFRGNQTIFVDGLLVDLMWDVHDWLFNLLSGSAVFMFRTRSSRIFDNRLWLQENHKMMMMPQTHKEDHHRVDFSLLIYASKNPWPV
ncbi:hypothetical protein Dimus_009420 [Dionaea muscipula]